MLDFSRTADGLIGRELQALRALGIPWPPRAGAHIHCPLPDHADETPSWRWDQDRRVAFCTCLGGRAADIVDVATRIRSGRPADALRWLCEAVGAEVVERPGRGGGAPAGAPTKPRGRHAAEGLAGRAAEALAPPAERASRDLPFRYLASRLHIPLEVARRVFADAPSVELAAGWTTREQWNRGTGGARASVTHRGPCVVFPACWTNHPTAPVSVWQIWTDASGHDRLRPDVADGSVVPKKSALGHPAGTVVAFGDPSSAAHWVMVEGIEDAAYAWAALRLVAPDRACEIAVLAGLAGPHLASVPILAHVRRITYAADRNEACAPTAPGFAAGLRHCRRAAARALETRGDALAASIVLPGAPGTKTDYLEVLEAGLPAKPVAEVLDLQGAAADAWLAGWKAAAGAIVSAILDRTGAVPLIDDNAPLGISNRGSLDLAELSRSLPPPRGLSLRLIDGVPWVGATDDDQDFRPIATAFSVAGWVQRTDTRELGLLVRVRDPLGEIRDVSLWGERLAPHTINAVLAQLRGNGLAFANVDALKAVLYREYPDPRSLIDVVPAPGWHAIERDGGRLVHVGLAGGVIGSDTRTVMLADDVRLPGIVTARGTLDDWRALVLDAIDQDERITAPHWLLGILLGLAGPLMALAQPNSAGVVLVGESSRGKSISLRLAAGCWSSPTETAGRGAYRTLAQTSNNIENVSAGASGMTLALDETALAKSADLTRILYKLASGAGSGRMRSDTSERPARTWRTLIVTSSERSIQTMVEEVGQVYQEGNRARFVEVPVDECGVGDEQGVKKFEARVMSVYGVAGPEFLRILHANGRFDDGGAELRRLVQQAAASLSEEAPPVMRRAAAVFGAALVAGELAKAANLLPREFPSHAVISWAWQAATAGIESLTPTDRALGRIQEFVSRRWGTSIVPLVGDDVRRSGPVDGWYDNDRVFIPTSVAQEASGNTLPARALARALQEAGWMEEAPQGAVRGDRKRHAAARRPDGGGWYRGEGLPRCRVYELLRSGMWPKQAGSPAAFDVA